MLLSVITPSWNAEDYIERCVRSVLQAGHPEVEHIVMDGLSSDGTVKILEQLKEEFGDKLKFVSEKDKSMTDAMVKAAKLATGKYIAPLNADDAYIPQNLPKVLDILKKDQPDALFGNVIFMNEDRSFRMRTKPKFAGSKFMWHFLGCFNPENGFFISRETYDKVGGYNDEFRYGQDYAMYTSVLKVTKPQYADIDIGAFQMRADQLSRSVQDVMEQEFIRCNMFGKFGALLQRTMVAKVFRVLLGTQSYSNKIEGNVEEKLGLNFNKNTKAAA